MPQLDKLIQPNRKPAFGLFDKPIRHINYEDFDYRTVTNKQASKLRKHFAYKQFQYFGAIADTLIFGCALANIRYLGACFVYVFDTATNEMLTWQFKTPFAMGLSMTDNTDNSASTFKLGSKQVKLSYVLSNDGRREKRLDVSIGSELQISAAMHEPEGFETKALCTPCAVNGWVYAQKTAALKVSGEVKCALGTIKLDDIECYGHHDFSSGFMRRETFWNWACFSAPPTQDKPAMGLNISWAVNETGYSENCLWLGSQCIELPQVQFEYDRDAILQTWHVRSANDAVKLSFTPHGKHSEQLNLGLLATDFHQIFGRFEGTIRLPNDELITISNVWGFVEHQFSRW